MLNEEIRELKRLRNYAEHKTTLEGSLLIHKHRKEYNSLNTVIKLLESNVKALHKCKHCKSLFFATRSKSYCSDNCRVYAHRKK